MYLGKKISAWDREKMTSERIQQAIALSGDSGYTEIKLKARGVVFVAAPWRSDAASYVDNQRVPYIILPRKVSIIEIAHEINIVLNTLQLGYGTDQLSVRELRVVLKL